MDNTVASILKHKKYLAIALLLSAWSQVTLGAVWVPDKLLSREQAEDPTLKLMDNPLKRMQGVPKEITTYKCPNVCEEKPYRHVKLDRKGRVIYSQVLSSVDTFEYGKDHDMPLVMKQDIFGDDVFMETHYLRDSYGNIVKEKYNEGLVRISFASSAAGFEVIKNTPNGAEIIETYRNGLQVERIHEGPSTFIRSDGSHYEAPAKKIDRRGFIFSRDGKLDRIEKYRINVKNGVEHVWHKEINYFDENGYLMAELLDREGRKSGVEYINRELDSVGNLIHYKRCNVAGEWGKYSRCESYKTTISYY